MKTTLFTVILSLSFASSEGKTKSLRSLKKEESERKLTGKFYVDPSTFAGIPSAPGIPAITNPLTSTGGTGINPISSFVPGLTNSGTLTPNGFTPDLSSIFDPAAALGFNPFSPLVRPTQDQFCSICGGGGGGRGKGKGRSRNKPTSLSLQYLPFDSQTSTFQGTKATCVQGVYPPSANLNVNGFNYPVTNGTVFSIDLSGGANTFFNFPDGSVCSIHTSCSVPLVEGDIVGPFRIIGEGMGCIDECVLCDKSRRQRLATLSFQYLPGEARTSALQGDKATCVAGTYPESTPLEVNGQNFQLENGTVFTISGLQGANTFFFFPTFACSIHTSCSVPLVENDMIGPFRLLGDGASCDAGFGCPTICDKDAGIKTRPEYLTLRYNPVGVTSPLQANRATCTAGPYPLTTSLTYIDGNQVPIPIGTVTNGTVFNIKGPFATNTEFFFGNTFSSCSFHTSCSAPIVVGDQIGPFEVLGDGARCPYEPPTPPPEPECVGLVDQAREFTCGEPITVNFNFEDSLADDWIGIYRCGTNLHAEVWQWACGSPGCTDAITTGTLTFDSLPAYNIYGPHTWPIAPYTNSSGVVSECFEVVYLRADGPSVPPYIRECVSTQITVRGDPSNPSCALRS